jgi:hypothetical protein
MKPKHVDTEEESKTDVNLLIRIDTKLLGCAFLYVQHGPLPVMYPSTALKIDRYGHDKFDGSTGGVCFKIDNNPVKVSFNSEEIAKTVLNFLNHVKKDSNG